MTTEEPDPTETPDTPRFGKQQIIGTILTLVVLILVFVVVLPQFGDYSEAWAAIQNMTAVQIGAIVIATIAVIIIYEFPYMAALPGIAFRPAFVIRQTSFMISNVIPMGGAIGLAVQYRMLSSYAFAPAPSTATIGITSVWNTFITLALPVFALVGLLITGQSNSQAVLLTLFGLVAVVVAIILFALILRNEENARKVGGWGNSVMRWGMHLIKRDTDIDVSDALVSFRNSIVDVVSVRWAIITFTNVLQQLSQFFVLYLAILALQGGVSGPISLIEAFAAFAFGRLATFIPIPPGGLGTTDAIVTSVLQAFGMSNNDALAATLVWRAATYFPQVFIGLITFLYWRRRESKRAVTA